MDQTNTFYTFNLHNLHIFFNVYEEPYIHFY